MQKLLFAPTCIPHTVVLTRVIYSRCPAHEPLEPYVLDKVSPLPACRDGVEIQPKTGCDREQGWHARTKVLFHNKENLA